MNKKSFPSEIKTFFLTSQVLSFRHAKQTSKNEADTTFKDTLIETLRFIYLITIYKTLT